MAPITILISIAATVLLLSAPTIAGPCWCESVDAGRLPASAQLPSGTGTMACIEGNLLGRESGDFEDMFLICICDVEGFSASVTLSDAIIFNPQLWLFKPVTAGTALGFLGNDDVSPANASAILLPVPTDGSPPLTEPGNYYLAITGFDNDPVSRGGFIFAENDFTEISGPDGPGGASPVIDWDPGTGEFGSYTIDLTGVTYPGHCTCTGDTNLDSEVDVVDLVNVILCWEMKGTKCPNPGSQSDVTGDLEVDVEDLVAVVLNWGDCEIGPCPDDGDGG